MSMPNQGLSATFAKFATVDEKQEVGGAQQPSVYGNSRLLIPSFAEMKNFPTMQLVAPAVGLCKNFSEQKVPNMRVKHPKINPRLKLSDYF